MTDWFAEQLLQWYDQHGRKNLPWHRDPSAYRIWVSEIMLQQTQVTTVIPYFERFMERFPTVEDLAAASTDEVMGYWSGLGYYARARNLHKAAITIVEQHDGAFPEGQDAIQQLPGIGRSTAAAIVAQAHGQRAAILDGNAKRVLARYHAVEGWPGRTAIANELWEHAEAHTPDERIQAYTQAIMDLGAMVCTRRRPGCAACPVREGCLAYARNNPEAYPGSKPKKEKPEKSVWMLVIEDGEGRILLEQRPPSGIWGGLMSFPEADPALQPEELPEHCETSLGLETSEPETQEPFRHTFSHYHLWIRPVRLTAISTRALQNDRSRAWLHRESALEAGLPAPIRRLLS
ncbi:A/G-specific adenine glycosylase [Vreelandella utahensis]|uniref:A/G-specific adenine glycosylase n=1 Tax=Vreelandella halophila TaxID=86177 RepID=UPI000986E827|nr:A/G-specific adenine glycosylase [Halomonas utahensis]